jgi:hypothetical protein
MRLHGLTPAEKLRSTAVRRLPALVIGCALAGLSLLHSLAEDRPALPAIEVKVLVLNFDPLIPQEGNRPLSEVCKFHNPRKLADDYVADMKQASGGRLAYRIVDWKNTGTFHAKVDGFTYTPEEWMKCWKEKKGWHQPDAADYPRTFRDYNVLPRIDSGEIDEVWFMGAPYFGYNESAMAGPRAFWINGNVYEDVPSKRPFAIMGYNYERGVAEMIHDLCHRAESTMARVYGGWKSEQLTNHWARFAATEFKSGAAGLGDCHHPPNAEKDYDYGNPRTVLSTAEDWLKWPNLTGATTPVNRDTWGGPDYHRNYMKWWFAHFPQAPGVNADGKLNDWWEYLFHFDRYDRRGKPREAE